MCLKFLLCSFFLIVIEANSFGVGTFLVSNLVNHSCLPNVDKSFHQTTNIALRVCRPIKKGEQIFDSYG
jgi:SET domain-containing protein